MRIYKRNDLRFAILVGYPVNNPPIVGCLQVAQHGIPLISRNATKIVFDSRWILNSVDNVFSFRVTLSKNPEAMSTHTHTHTGDHPAWRSDSSDFFPPRRHPAVIDRRLTCPRRLFCIKASHDITVIIICSNQWQCLWMAKLVRKYTEIC